MATQRNQTERISPKKKSGRKQSENIASLNLKITIAMDRKLRNFCRSGEISEFVRKAIESSLKKKMRSN